MSNYISNFAEMIIEICKEEKITCTPLSNYWAFYLTYKERENYIYGYQFGLNTAVSHALCSDKSTASDALTMHDIPNVAHICCMSPLTMEYASPSGNNRILEEMLQKYGKIVLKDNHGTGGVKVYKASNRLEAEHAAQIIFTSAESMAVSPYLPIDKEYRVILLDREVKLMYRKVRPHVIGDGVSTLAELYASYIKDNRELSCFLPPDSRTDFNKIPENGQTYALNWKHNLGQGAKAEVLSPDQTSLPVIELALRTARALGIRFASIDIIDAQKELKVLEVNSGVMMEYLAKQSDELRQTAKNIYRDAILKMMKA